MGYQTSLSSSGPGITPRQLTPPRAAPIGTTSQSLNEPPDNKFGQFRVDAADAANVIKIGASAPGYVMERPIAAVDTLTGGAAKGLIEQAGDTIRGIPILGDVLSGVAQAAGNTYEGANRVTRAPVNAGMANALRSTYGMNPNDKVDGITAWLSGAGGVMGDLTVAQLREIAAQRGFSEKDIQDIASGRRGIFDYADRAVSNNPLVDLAGSLALDPTNYLTLGVAGAALGGAAKVGRLIPGAARIAELSGIGKLAAGTHAINAAVDVSRVKAVGTAAGMAMLREGKVTGVTLPTLSRHLAMMFRGTSDFLTGYRKVAYATTAGQIAAQSVGDLGVLDNTPLGQLYEPLYKAAKAMGENKPLSEGGMFNLWAAINFPIRSDLSSAWMETRKYGLGVGAGKATVRTGLFKRVSGIERDVIGELAPGMSTSAGRQKLVQELGGEQNFTDMLLHFARSLYAERELPKMNAWTEALQSTAEFATSAAFITRAMDKGTIRALENGTITGRDIVQHIKDSHTGARSYETNPETGMKQPKAGAVDQAWDPRAFIERWTGWSGKMRDLHALAGSFNQAYGVVVGIADGALPKEWLAVAEATLKSMKRADGTIAKKDMDSFLDSFPALTVDANDPSNFFARLRHIDSGEVHADAAVQRIKALAKEAQPLREYMYDVKQWEARAETVRKKRGTVLDENGIPDPTRAHDIGDAAVLTMTQQGSVRRHLGITDSLDDVHQKRSDVVVRQREDIIGPGLEEMGVTVTSANQGVESIGGQLRTAVAVHIPSGKGPAEVELVAAILAEQTKSPYATALISGADALRRHELTRNADHVRFDIGAMSKDEGNAVLEAIGRDFDSSFHFDDTAGVAHIFVRDGKEQAIQLLQREIERIVPERAKMSAAPAWVKVIANDTRGAVRSGRTVKSDGTASAILRDHALDIRTVNRKSAFRTALDERSRVAGDGGRPGFIGGEQRPGYDGVGRDGQPGVAPAPAAASDFTDAPPHVLDTLEAGIGARPTAPLRAPYGHPDFHSSVYFNGMDYGREVTGELSKVHVAATEANAQQVLEAVDRVARDMGVRYKWVGDAGELAPGKDFGPGGVQQGKFITAYPDPQIARQFTERVDAELQAAGITGGDVASSERRFAPDSPITHRWVPDPAQGGDRYAVDGDYAAHTDHIGTRYDGVGRDGQPGVATPQPRAATSAVSVDAEGSFRENVARSAASHRSEVFTGQLGPDAQDFIDTARGMGIDIRVVGWGDGVAHFEPVPRPTITLHPDFPAGDPAKSLEILQHEVGHALQYHDAIRGDLRADFPELGYYLPAGTPAPGFPDMVAGNRDIYMAYGPDGTLEPSHAATEAFAHAFADYGRGAPMDPRARAYMARLAGRQEVGAGNIPTGPTLTDNIRAADTTGTQGQVLWLAEKDDALSALTPKLGDDLRGLPPEEWAKVAPMEAELRRFDPQYRLKLAPGVRSTVEGLANDKPGRNAPTYYFGQGDALKDVLATSRATSDLMYHTVWKPGADFFHALFGRVYTKRLAEDAKQMLYGDILRKTANLSDDERPRIKDIDSFLQTLDAVAQASKLGKAQLFARGDLLPPDTIAEIATGQYTARFIGLPKTADVQAKLGHLPVFAGFSPATLEALGGAHNMHKLLDRTGSRFYRDLKERTRSKVGGTPPPAPGMLRLYRGEGGSHMNSVKGGGWFSTDKEKAAQYGTVRYIDIPNTKESLVRFVGGLQDHELFTTDPAITKTTQPLLEGRATNRGQLGALIRNTYSASRVATATPRNYIKTFYHLFRFTLDPRWHVLNRLEADALGHAKYAVSRFNGALSPDAVDNAVRLHGGGVVSHKARDITVTAGGAETDLMRDALASGVLDSRHLEGYAGRSFKKGRVNSTKEVIRTMAQEDPSIVQTLQQFGGTPDEWVIGLEDKMYNFDNKGVQTTITSEAQKILDAKQLEELTPLLIRLYERNNQVFRDVVQTFHGNTNRGNLERILNSYFLFWPISYQIKVTKWLFDVMTKQALGRQTNFAGVWTLDHMYQKHVERLANDEGYQRMFTDNPALWQFAAMLLPITPFDMGISLSRFTRYSLAAGGFINDKDFSEDPFDSALSLLKMGPLYSYELARKVYAQTKDDPKPLVVPVN